MKLFDLLFIWLDVLIMLIVAVILLRKRKTPLNIIITLFMLFLSGVGIILHIYEIGKYNFEAWNLIVRIYHYGQPYRSDDFIGYILTALNPHGLGFGFSDMKYLLIFCKATTLWQNALFVAIAATLIFNLSILFRKSLIRYRKAIMLIMLITPIIITAWPAISLAPYSILFVCASLSLCPISYMLMAFPFAYYFLNKNKNLKTASE